jgi:2-polyprenyl-3-methyl-5-hydroxy-6-metoxy-1,4-benzoquinol methylase
MNTAVERITGDQVSEQDGHRYRYRMASDWVEDGQSVVDIACGVGYGSEIIQGLIRVDYYGFDKIEPEAKYANRGEFIAGVDLNTFVLPASYDLGLCFETLEHLENPEHLAGQLMTNTTRFMVSVPTVPTKHENPYHLHDFTVDDILSMFSACELLHIEAQPTELSHIFVFRSPDA